MQKVISADGDIIDQETGLQIVECLKCGKEYLINSECECKKVKENQ